MRSHVRPFRRLALLPLALGWLLMPALTAANGPTLTEPQKIAIIQDLVNTVGVARRALPPGKKGVELGPDGKVLNADQVMATLQSNGVAEKTGDRVAITGIEFKDDRIVFLINGGPRSGHWYDHVQFGMGGTAQSTPLNPAGPTGAVVTLKYAANLPPLTPEAVRNSLNTLIDWDPPAKATVMVQALPVTVKAAIDEKRALVGMTPDMVVAALGRTDKKDRETDPASGEEFEDWIYGTPPAATQFIRFANNRVVQITTYEPGGKQVVDTTPDPGLIALEKRQDAASAAKAATAASQEGAPAQAAPSLRRPGDPAPPNTGGSSPNVLPPPPMPPGGGPANSGCCSLF